MFPIVVWLYAAWRWRRRVGAWLIRDRAAAQLPYHSSSSSRRSRSMP